MYVKRLQTRRQPPDLSSNITAGRERLSMGRRPPRMTGRGGQRPLRDGCLLHSRHRRNRSPEPRKRFGFPAELQSSRRSFHLGLHHTSNTKYLHFLLALPPPQYRAQHRALCECTNTTASTHSMLTTPVSRVTGSLRDLVLFEHNKKQQ